jgi:hypothetical protein
LVASITAALIAAGILGLAFSTTRGVAIAAIAALTFIYPALAIVVIVGAGVAIYLNLSRK